MAAPSGQDAQASPAPSSPTAARTEYVPPEAAPVLRPIATVRAGRSLRDSGSSACESSSSASSSSESEDNTSESSDDTVAEPPVDAPAVLDSAPLDKQASDSLISGHSLFVRRLIRSACPSGLHVFTVFVDNASCLCAAGLQPLSPYEQERAENIARNKAELAKLGLGSSGTALLPPPASRRGRRARRSRPELVSAGAQLTCRARLHAAPPALQVSSVLATPRLRQKLIPCWRRCIARTADSPTTCCT